MIVATQLVLWPVILVMQKTKKASLGMKLALKELTTTNKDTVQLSSCSNLKCLSFFSFRVY